MKLLSERKIGSMNVNVLFQQCGIASCDTQDIEVGMAADVILGMESADEETKQQFIHALIIKELLKPDPSSVSLPTVSLHCFHLS